MNAFLIHEPFQQYVDGGLYAMNLINALQYNQLASIPLTCGIYNNHAHKLKQIMDIPDNESLIVMIGTGEMLDHFNVAVSTRKDIKSTNTYH